MIILFQFFCILKDSINLFFIDFLLGIFLLPKVRGATLKRCQLVALRKIL